MIKAAIEKIINLAGIQTVSVDDKTYSNEPLARIKPAIPAPMEIPTLGGLIDYLGTSDVPDSEILIVVNNALSVSVYESLEETYPDRVKIATCDITRFEFDFRHYYNTEEFRLQLLTNFAQGEIRDLLIDLVSNIRAKEEISLSDDGLTQEAVRSKGISFAEKIKLPNPIALRPKISFPEVPQLAMNLVVRANQNGESVLWSLHAADRQRWELEAIREIGEYLKKQTAEIGNVRIIS